MAVAAEALKPLTKEFNWEQAEGQFSEPEKRQSFDILSSVSMVRHDLDRYGKVLPETQQRVYDEELTLIAEGIDRFSYTSFNLQEKDGQLVFFDRGEWKPYVGTLLTGLQVAVAEEAHDYRRGFLTKWAARDLEVGYKLERLQPGEVLCWDSAFPHVERERYGDEFLSSVGLQPKRQMGFMYRAKRNTDGSVTLETHSIDGSDPEAFDAARSSAESTQHTSIHDQVAAYDDVLAQKHGETFYAGRKLSEKASMENAWDFLGKNKSLIDFYMSEIHALAKSNMTGDTLYRAKKALTIGVWARTKELLDSHTAGDFTSEQPSTYSEPTPLQVREDVYRALTHAVERQDVMIGCGGGVSAKGLLDMSSSEAFDTLFGAGPSDRFGPLKFECKNGHENVRPQGQLIDCCKTCGVSVKC